jgi:hypothetical protein
MTITVEVDTRIFRPCWETSRRYEKTNYQPIPFTELEQDSNRINCTNALATLVLQHANGQSYHLKINADAKGKGGLIYDHAGVHNKKLNTNDIYTSIPGVTIKGS